MTEHAVNIYQASNTTITLDRTTVSTTNVQTGTVNG